jgi:hypothetical protein
VHPADNSSLIISNEQAAEFVGESENINLQSHETPVVSKEITRPFALLTDQRLHPKESLAIQEPEVLLNKPFHISP